MGGADALDEPWDGELSRTASAMAEARAQKWSDAPASPRRRLVAAVLLAQLLSLCLAVTGISSASLAAAGVALPTSQSLLNYALLALTFGSARLAAGGALARPWWCYALLALVDVEANFLVVKAYQYTSLTSVTLLDCFTIPAVITLSVFLLGARYNRAHYAAAAICVAGLALLVASEGRSATAGPAPLLGDAMVVAGALLYAISNVTQELYLGDAPASEVLGMVGAFGALAAGAQAFLLERGAWAALLAGDNTGSASNTAAASLGAVAGALAAFTAALFTFSSLVPVVLLWGGATALNLSLLTSDLWAAAARVALFGGFGGGGWWFAASLSLVAAGLVMYASAGATGGGGGGGEAGAAPSTAGGGGFAACRSADEEAGAAPSEQPRRWPLAGGAGGAGAAAARPGPAPAAPAAGVGAGWLEGVFASGLLGGPGAGAPRRWGSPRSWGSPPRGAARGGGNGGGEQPPEERRLLARPSLDGCEAGP